jgi:FAD/FMN-containing dehydrogenase
MPDILTPASVHDLEAAVRASISQPAPWVLDDSHPAMPARHLSLAGLNGWRFFEPRDLTCGVEAGLAPQALEQRLSAAGLLLPLDFPHSAAAPLGAALAGHHSGPLRHGYGSLRDWVIGIEFISGAGELIHAGGRVVKNVAGYDLMKLLIGSRGSFGIITAAHFRLFPQPPASATWLVACPDWPAAARLRAQLQASHLKPAALELATTLPAACAAFMPDSPGLVIVIRSFGSEAVQARYERELNAMAHICGCPFSQLPGAAQPEFWRAWNQAPALAPIRFSAPPTHALTLLPQLQAMAGNAGFHLAVQGRLGLGIYRLRTTPELPLSWLPQARKALEPQGEFWLTSPGGPPHDAWGPLATSRDFLRELKRTLDPHEILPDPFGLRDGGLASAGQGSGS